MSADSTMNFVVIFEEEVRAAAKALASACELGGGSEEDQQEAWANAMQACMVALAGADRDEATLMMASKASMLSRGKATP